MEFMYKFRSREFIFQNTRVWYGGCADPGEWVLPSQIESHFFHEIANPWRPLAPKIETHSLEPSWDNSDKIITIR